MPSISLALVKHSQVLSSIAKDCQALPSIAKHYQALPSIDHNPYKELLKSRKISTFDQKVKMLSEQFGSLKTV